MSNVFYHPTKQAAIDSMQDLCHEFNIRAELEPYNGWVAVLTPINYKGLSLVNVDLLERCEFDIQMRLRRRHATFTKPPSDQPKAKVKEEDLFAGADDNSPTAAADWKKGDALPW